MNKKFSMRAFISIGLTYSFIIILFSGIILYMAPPGRYANWVDWEIIGFTKERWQAIHTIFSFTFVVLSILHLFLINWKTFFSYLKSKARKGLNKKRELLLSTILILLFFFGTILSFQPFNAVMDFGEYLTESWEKAEERAPVPHAELLTLAELAEQLDMQSHEEFITKLKNHNITFENVHTQTLREIASANNTTPVEVYEIITKKAGIQGQGSGVGRKTIEEYASELNKSVDEIMSILQENNISAEKEQTLRTIGEENNITPRDIYELISK